MSTTLRWSGATVADDSWIVRIGSVLPLASYTLLFTSFLLDLHFHLLESVFAPKLYLLNLVVISLVAAALDADQRLILVKYLIVGFSAGMIPEVILIVGKWLTATQLLALSSVPDPRICSVGGITGFVVGMLRFAVWLRDDIRFVRDARLRRLLPNVPLFPRQFLRPSGVLNFAGITALVSTIAAAMQFLFGDFAHFWRAVLNTATWLH